MTRWGVGTTVRRGTFSVAVASMAVILAATLSVLMNSVPSYALSGTWSWDTANQNSIRASNLTAGGVKLTSSQSGQGSILFVSAGGTLFSAQEIYPQSAGYSTCLMTLNIQLAANSGTNGTLTADDTSGGSCPDPAYLQGILNDIKANPNITISGTVPAGYSTTDIANSGGGTNGGANSTAGQWVAGQDGGVTTSNYTDYTPAKIAEICAETYLNGDGKPSGWTMDRAKYDTCVKNGQAAVDRASTAANKGKPNCAVDGIGWIVCPVSKAIATIVDTIYKNFIEPLMRAPALPMDTKSNLYTVWGDMRGIANVMFVIAFIFIIYSQITSLGISNYSIKKMLPKLILGAIFINISYFVCAFFVDLSNFLGTSLFDLLSAKYGTSIDGVSWESLILALLAGGSLATVAGLAAFATAAGSVMSILWMALPLLAGALIAVVTAAIVLALRQAFIVILIVVSPLAIAAYLLPNTQSWFNKWKGWFTTMLMFFPLFSLIIGGSQLAAGVLFASAKDFGANNPLQGAAVVLAAMAVQVLPFFAAPFVMKFSGGVLGMLGGKVLGNINKLAAPVKDYSKKRSNLAQLRTQNKAFEDMNATGRFGGLRRAKARMVRGFDRRGELLDKRIGAAQAEREGRLAVEAATDSDFIEQYSATKDANATAHDAQLLQAKNYAKSVLESTSATPAQKASAQSTLDDLERKEVAAHMIALSSEGAGRDELKRVLDSTETPAAQKAAALERLISIDGPGAYEQYVNQYAADTEFDNRIIRQRMAEGLKESGMYKGSQLTKMAEGTFTWGGDNGADMKDLVRINAKNRVMSSERVGKMANDDLDYISDAVSGDVDARTQIMKDTAALLDNPRLNASLGHTREKLERLRATGSTS